MKERKKSRQRQEELTSVKEMDQQMEKLSMAMEKEAARNLEELQEIVEDQGFDAAEELKQQIAEDEALEAELKREAEESESDPDLKAALPQMDADGNLDVQEIESCVEALLFISEKPLSLNKLQEFLGPDFSSDIFEEALKNLQERYGQTCHGIELIQVAGGYQFRTKVGRAALARKLAKVQTQRLSRGAMETLAIVAYKQPVMKDDIDSIRGVDSSHFIRGLMEKKLVHISGRSELPGRPMLYTTTNEFLEIFGLNHLSGLPPLRELEQMIPASESDRPDENEDPKIRELRRLVDQMKTDSEDLGYNPAEDEIILKDIKDRVKSIEVTTPYIEHQKAVERGEIPAEEDTSAEVVQLELKTESPVAVEPVAEMVEEPSLADDELDEIARAVAAITQKPAEESEELASPPIDDTKHLDLNS